MSFVADLHIHSHFSRATSPNLVPEDLSLWAQRKGIALVGTGDVTHPGWVSELRERLVEAENGLYRLRPDLRDRIDEALPASCREPTRFLLSGEISCIYKRGGRTRKVHNLILMPDFDSVLRFNEKLGRIGNITSDGRPILGLDSRDLLEIALEASDRTFFIPAHIWTPWFSLFGSKSGFDVIEECFADLTPHIHALETGLSSDPPMNRLLSALDSYLLVSNSDAHSPGKLGREANLFDTPLDYDRIRAAMTDGQGFEGTIEFFPEEGKYHYDGHRKCNVCLHPGEALEYGGICPVCGRPLTLGVLHRILELSDRDAPRLSKPFHSLIPLPEILSEILDCGPATKKVAALYEELLAALGPELRILMDTPLEEIEKAGGMLLAEALDRMRRDRVIRQEGYDGEYGVIRLFRDGEMSRLVGQGTLFRMEGAPERERAPGAKKRPQAIKKREKAPAPGPKPEDPLLDPLNPEQREAVEYRGSHLLIVAGPGTGKTLTLTHRIAHLIRSGQAAPGQVLALAFTNKAALEIRDRIRALVPGGAGDGVKVATFHGFCLEVLREEGQRLGLPSDFTLCSEPDAQSLARRIADRSGKGTGTARSLLRNLSSLKAASLAGGDPDPSLQDLLPLFERYQRELRSLGMLDFDDLEVETLRLFREHPKRAWAARFPWIFVDEYQDTNPVQVALLKSLVYAESASSEEYPCNSFDLPETSNFPQGQGQFRRTAELDSFQTARKGEGHGRPESKQGIVRRHTGGMPHNQSRGLTRRLGERAVSAILCAIGDPDQAIYGFRGADVGSFNRFAEDFPGAREIVLSRNYRSTQAILDAASSLMGRERPLEGQVPGGAPLALSPCRTPGEEAEMCVEQIERLLGGTTYFSLDSGRVASHEEGENLGFGDIAVLFRLNALGDAFEEALSRAGIPYVRSGERPLIGRYPANVLWRFFQVLENPGNPHYRAAYLELLAESGLSSPIKDKEGLEGDFLQLSPDEDLPALIDRAAALHGLGDLSEEETSTLGRLKEMAGQFTGDLASFLDLLSLDRAVDHRALIGDRVALMSLHAAKGLEWPVVFIAGCEDRLLPCTLFGDRDDEEERRLFYVGMTRARSRLILSHASRRSINGRDLDMNPSPFLSLIPPKCCAPLERGSWKPKKKPHKQLDLF
ncbi:MAG: UvrD-helicase domain-containing protein [Deltaproteobacteria bacterium]|nr:UvrD-helicase domain-containing protein [Deltaproteobacteria bacterium]